MLMHQPIWVDVPRVKGRALFPEYTVAFRNVTSSTHEQIVTYMNNECPVATKTRTHLCKLHNGGGGDSIPPFIVKTKQNSK